MILQCIQEKRNCIDRACGYHNIGRYSFIRKRKIRELLDMKIYVDTDADIRILRRLMRDMKERGRSVDSVVNQYLDVVRPMHLQFIEPSKNMQI